MLTKTSRPTLTRVRGRTIRRRAAKRAAPDPLKSSCRRARLSVRAFAILPICALPVIVPTSAGCKSVEPRVRMWVLQEPTVPQFRRGAQAPFGDGAGASNRVELAGAINETLSFCFALRPSGSAVLDPDISATPFVSGDSSPAPIAVSLFRMHPVRINTWPGWHVRYIAPARRDALPHDVLVPLRAPRGGLPASLHPALTNYFWADVTIPKGVGEGAYRSSIVLTDAGVRVGEIDVKLEVWPFVLPESAAVPLLAELDHRRLFSHHVRLHGRPYAPVTDDWSADPLEMQLDVLLGSTLRTLHAHRLSPVLPGLGPTLKVSAQGDVTVNWAHYDRVVEPLLDGDAFFSRTPLQAWPVPLHVLLRGGSNEANRTQSRSALALQHRFVRNCEEHFRQRGWIERAYVLAQGSARPSPETAEAAKRLASIVHDGSAGLRIAARLFPQDLHDFGWHDFPRADLSDSVDIWVPDAQFFDVEEMTVQRGGGRATWVAIDRPPFSGSTSVHAPPAYVRVIPWHAKELGAQATWLGCVNNWPDANENPVPEDCVRYDPGALLYPGGAFGLDEPVASARLKYLRRGAQDAAYAELLASHGLEHVAATLRNSLTPYQGSRAYRTHFADGRAPAWPDQLAPFEAARNVMASELLRVRGGRPPGTVGEDFERSVAWRQLMDQTRQVELGVDGVRVRLMGTREDSVFDVEFAIAVHNGTRVPIAGSIVFPELPKLWAAEESYPVRQIPPGGSRRMKLRASADANLRETGGCTYVPMELDTGGDANARAPAPIAYLTALPVRSPINIDGDLSDWPLGSVNVASDFALISRAEIDADHNEVHAAQSRTSSFVLRDADNLYVGVNCEADELLAQPRTRRNSVVYDDMIPVGQELVELLIDPLNAGTRSPSDLYHVVIKYGGGHSSEKGIGFDPPCGRRETWASDFELATRDAPGRWTAEVRIPLDAFGAVPREHTVWGFNVTRYDLVNQEFSTWSAARHNAYDPISLGNLYLPPLAEEGPDRPPRGP